jgi:hypothetical protein
MQQPVRTPLRNPLPQPELLQPGQSEDSGWTRLEKLGTMRSFGTRGAHSPPQAPESGPFEGFRGVAQPGSALALGARGPRFKSGRPDQYLSRIYVAFTAAKF